MVVESPVSRDDYTGNGAANEYSFSFYVFLDADSDLLVTVRDDSTPAVETTLVLNTDYTVSGTGEDSGGKITLVDSGQSWLTAGGNLKSGYEISIRRLRDLLQQTDIRNQGAFDPEIHEDAFDHLVMLAQQHQDEIDRSIKLPETEAGTDALITLPAPADRASKFFAWNASGEPIAADGSAGVPASTFMATVLDDLTAAAARTTLGFASETHKQDVKGADIASAATVDLDAATGDLVDITGTTTITAITLAEGVERTVRFTGALTLTHGASLVLPGSANITTVAGSYGVFRGYASGVVRLVNYTIGDLAPFDRRAPGAIGGTTPADGDFAALTATGLLDLSAAGAGQIKFPGTQNASSNANTLDDYEEGTWTPTLTFGVGGNLNVVYAERAALYTKNGREVTVHFRIRTSTFTHTTASGDVHISGIPFTVDSVPTNGLFYVGPWQAEGITKAGYTSFAWRTQKSATEFTGIATGSGQTHVTVQAGDMPTGGTVDVQSTVTYNSAT